MADELPKSRDASKPFYWDALPDEEIESARRGFLENEHAKEIAAVKCSHDKAIELLEIAANYLESREQMPYPLADYIAKAFRATARAKATDALSITEASRNTLAATLYITASRRPKTTAKEVGTRMYRLMMERAQNRKPLTETAAAKEVATMLNIGLQTVKDHWIKWQGKNPDSYRRLKRDAKAFKNNG